MQPRPSGPKRAAGCGDSRAAIVFVALHHRWRENGYRGKALGACLTALAALCAIPAMAGAASTESRYSIVGGCYALQDVAGGGFVREAGNGYAATAPGLAGAEPFRMQATTLGRYLLYGSDRDFLSLSGSDAEVAVKPSNATDLTVERPGEAFTIRNHFSGDGLAVAADGSLAGGEPASFNLVEASGCADYPEIETNVEGAPSTGSPGYGETEGMLEGHMHHMAFRFLAGAHCGRPWHRFGVEYALVDCPDHEPNGCAAVLETALGGDPCHDPTGWPEFTDWPAPHSLTHEQSYYKWLERAWRGGLRVFVNLMVQNRALCEIYPIKGNNRTCDDSDTVEIELDEAYRLQDYIDAQEGGPGEGWYRIVRTPFQARKVINEGKLAVVLGMEVSEPFHCRMFNGVPTCDQDEITREIQHLYDRGVRQMEITNKFDNALTGVAGDNGETGTLVNTGNFYATGRFWDLETCQHDDPEEHDHAPTGVPAPPHNDDAILGNLVQAFLPPGALPAYPPPPLCNTRGLTELGEHAIHEMIERGMIFDPDHMSVKGRDAAMNLVESEKYSGVISSHSWSTPSALPRIYRLGGVVTPYAGDSESFVHQWEHARSAHSGRQFFGIGYGADQNGFGSQGEGRGEDAPSPVTYPFKSIDGEQTIGQQVSGERVYDINVDGVAHYGLYPDWVEDLRQLAGKPIIEDMRRGAEAYLQMWERAVGVPKVRCPVWRGRFSRRGLDRSLRVGEGARKTLFRAGQPVERERVWRWCTRFKKDSKRKLGKRRRVSAVFDRKGRMRVALSTLAKNRAGGLGRGDRKRELRGEARSLGRGVWVERGRRGRNAFIYGTRGKKIRYAGVAHRKVARSDRRLRRYVKRAGLK